MPKLVTVLREGYRLSHLKADAIAGLTVAIVALPLSMAIAIASGATPAQGLYTAIVGGFFVSLLGGSRFQIGGPAGAFIVLVATTVQTHGMDGLLLATMISGVMLATGGFLRIGTYIKFIPYPVTVGFTAGIAVIIFSSQIKDLLGLALSEPEPAALVAKLPVLWSALPTLDITTVALAGLTILIIAGLAKARPRWPGMLIAIAVTATLAVMLDLKVATIGSVFGGIPNTLPTPTLPEISFAKVWTVLPNAVAFTLLGSIESLLSAVVADGMTGRRHRSNCELVAQGVANIASALFGGICVTGTIARTATNVRAGAHGPVAGMLHAAFLLLFILVAAPLARFIPLASLAGVLAVVAWNMIEKRAFAALMRASAGDAAVLLATFLLTVFRDLTEGIVVGVSLGAILFIHRMSKATSILPHAPLAVEDQADGVADAGPYDEARAADPDIVVYRISGAFFFGAAAAIASVLDRVADTSRVLVIDFTAVPFLDSTGVNVLETMVKKAKRHGVRVMLTGTTSRMRKEMFIHGLKPPLVHYERTIDDAVAKYRHSLAEAEDAAVPVA